MCFKARAPKLPDTPDPEAQQREAAAKAAQEGAAQTQDMRRRRGASSLQTASRASGTALGLYGGGNKRLGGDL